MELHGWDEKLPLVHEELGRCLDLKKAFDSVDHKILLTKLKYSGLTEATISWFRSYLSGRTQLTKVNGIKLDTMRVEYGVPQGSILGPLLFVMFINDLPSQVSASRIHLYADDTAITVSASNSSDLENRLNLSLREAGNWMKMNKLTLNAKKTMAMCFGTRQTLQQIPPLAITYNNTKIEVVSEFKYLGVILDPTLSFSNHAEYVRNKSASRQNARIH